MSAMSALLLAAVAPYLNAQSTGALEGAVTTALTHSPVAAAVVTLKAAETKHSTVTDVSGRYAFADLKPGEYTVEYAAAAFMPNRRAIRIAAAIPTTMSVELVPLAALRGRVLDDERRPAPDVRVELLRSRAGQPSTQSTDQEGRFVFEKLAPGTYLLVARPVLAGSYLAEGRPERLSKLPDSSEAERTAWAPTWFPGLPSRDEAQTITVRAGADLRDYEIRLRRAAVFRVRGIVMDDTGKPVPRAVINLLPPDLWLTQEARVVAKADGTFEFPAVRRGTWRMEAEAQFAGVTQKGVAVPAVTNHDLEEVEIRLAPPFTLAGFVHREEPRDSDGKRKVSAISLLPHGWNGSRELTFHEQDGRFLFKRVYPGRYTIFPLGFVPGYYLDSVRLGDQEVIGKPVELTSGALPVRIAYRPNAGRLRGAVEQGEGAAIVAIPQDEAFMDGQFIRKTKCDHGRYDIDSLRPGDYYVFAFDRIDDDALEDPVFVRNIAPYAVTVRVQAGQPAQADLRVTRWPE
jgi:protocatechuate 3,4-dioxygenase beta subunit